MSTAFSERIRQIVSSEGARMRLVTDTEASRAPAAPKWCRKEVLGHLVDSAANNHQRFVRALLAEELVFPAYVQNDWVKAQKYSGESWEDVVDLWCALNRHLAHLIEGIPAAKLSTQCRIGENTPMTLEALIADYIRHMVHHLAQIESGGA
jgi:hypothetical protein